MVSIDENGGSKEGVQGGGNDSISMGETRVSSSMDKIQNFFRSSRELGSRKFWKLADERDQFSRSVSSSTSSHPIRERLRGVFRRRIDWEVVRSECREWFRNPMNLALFVWIVCVAVSGAILFLVMTGMLNEALKSKTQRNTWFEVNNQILNALFTLMCVYQHPKRFYHLILLLRWKPDDVSALRKIYCKNGTYKPHEWAHMMVVVTLLHVNCFAQYALCGLNVGYKRSQRPALGVAVCISVAIAAPAIAGVYLIVSPLGKEYDFRGDEESLEAPISIVEDRQRNQRGMKTVEKRFAFVAKDDSNMVETNPRWKGGILDFWEDISLAYLSLFCSFCVFGWNMERLGFGNMYVHMATFILFCSAPYWIFSLAAVNIDNESVRQGLVISGVLLCVFGLLYGGYWRIRMRKRFNLPEYKFCCGKPSLSDCTLWLCCFWCSLAQEVRTANSYDVMDNKHSDESIEMGNSQLASGGPADNISGPSSPLFAASGPTVTTLPSPLSSPAAGNHHTSLVTRHSAEESSNTGMDKNYMMPPSPLFIEK